MHFLQSITCIFFLFPFAQGFVIQSTSHRPRYALRMADVAEHVGLNYSVASALKKSSKTLAVVMDVLKADESRSMQLRQLKASALSTSNIDVAKLCVKEQATAKGNFPGPCPILYTGSNVEEARLAGVDAVVVTPGSTEATGDVIYRIKSVKEFQTVSNHNAFWVDVNDDIASVQSILEAIPETAVVLASLKSMQEDNNELKIAPQLRNLGVSALVFQNAVAGDGEDLEYSSFVIDGVTKKKSSTFNLTGLTGSTNGHFGGVASSQPRTWLRLKRAVETQ